MQLARSKVYPHRALLFKQLPISGEQAQMLASDNNLPLAKVPFTLLFKDGALVKDQRGPVLLYGNPSRSELKSFIDNYLALDIAQYVKEERHFKKYESVVKDRMYLYYQPYFSKVANPWNDWWGWPYYGMAQGNYGGNVGINFFASNY